MEEVHIYAPEVIADKFKNIASAMTLLSVYMKLANELNEIKAGKDELAAAMGVTRRTITIWIDKLRDNGVIKYKYSGSTRLNPFFYYNGTRDGYDRAVAGWNSFVSDDVSAKKLTNKGNQ